MKKLYAPWRSSYVTDPHKEKKRDGCPFCTSFKQSNDDQNYILKRSEHGVLMLNLYPYNAGHLMVLPKEHVGELAKLTAEVRSDLMELVNEATELLERVLKTHGINVGINQGIAGGGGIPSHLHIHVLPRWKSDTSFLPLIGDVKAVSVDLDEVFSLLKSGLL